ncbi:MAG: UDP-N-acetylmuramoyl-L-alanine--D-glutamate ligase [Burkholderiales bacterium]|nr:UDP-N-acetylmuramoyl-L-alanine--D-glutamate ligase [Burkholderiales bacterium]
MPLEGRRVLVLGLGDTGLSAACWLARAGARVRIADTRTTPPGAALLGARVPQAERRFGAFDPSLLDGIDLVCLSPGLALAEPVVQAAIGRGLPVLGDIELFAWALRETPGARVAAITGTNGKTTVSALVGHLLRAAGIDCEVAGNIGPAALDALLRRTARSALPAAWVLELSSYQLETTWSLAPEVATVLNLSEDHLDRYASLEEYGAAKARVFSGAALAVVNRDDARAAALAADATRRASFGLDAPPRAADFGVLTRNGSAWLARGQRPIVEARALGVHGRHNLANALAAAALARALGADDAAIAGGLATFRGLPHRLQRIARRAGVAWYDDSKGTNVGATVAALRGLDAAGRVVLIAGGDGKGQDFAPLAAPVAARARAVLVIGRDAPRIEAALAACGVPLERCARLEDAVARAAALARPGDAVLLSPACASFDMFRDYRERGELFARAVRALGD